MKTPLTFFCLLLCIALHAQDVIIKKSGEHVKAKVEEITTDMAKYREFENLTGPLYNMPLIDIEKINFENGTMRYYGQIAKPKQATATTPYDSLMKLHKSSKFWGVFGIVTGTAFVATGAALLAVAPKEITDRNNPNYTSNNTTRTLDLALGSILVVGGALELIIAPISLVKSKKYFEAARQHKQQSYMRLPQLQLAKVGNYTGIGLSTSITF